MRDKGILHQDHVFLAVRVLRDAARRQRWRCSTSISRSVYDTRFVPRELRPGVLHFAWAAVEGVRAKALAVKRKKPGRPRALPASVWPGAMDCLLAARDIEANL